MTGRLRNGQINLRGWTVLICAEGRWRRVPVITHLRHDRWLVAYRGRLIVIESEMRAPKPPR